MDVPILKFRITFSFPFRDSRLEGAVKLMDFIFLLFSNFVKGLDNVNLHIGSNGFNLTHIFVIKSVNTKFT